MLKKMIKKIIILITLFVGASLQSNVYAQQVSSDLQLDKVAKLGELNGIALQCGYKEQMQKIKQALILNLPKKRALGDWFESTTNASFLDFFGNKKCGSLAIFTLQVDKAIIELENAFKD